MATAASIGKTNSNVQDGGASQGLHNLVEAATALTQLVNRIPTSTHTVSDDESTQLVDGAAAKTHTESQKDNVKGELKSNDVSVNPSSKETSSKSTDSTKEIFPQRLMHILSQASISDIISWLPHGRAFVIVRPGELAETILPTYFPEGKRNVGKPSSCKYPSFTRKLNRWGFRLLSRGPDSGAFHHELFRRDEPELCLRMVCQRSRRRKSEEGGSTQSSKIRKRSSQYMKLPTTMSRISPSTTDNESVNSYDSSPKKQKVNNMNSENVVTAPSTTTITVTPGNSTLPPISSLPHPVTWQSLSSISAMPSSQVACTPSVGSNLGVPINSKPQLTKESFPTSLPIAAVLQDKNYLDARALLEHNLAINAAIAMAQVNVQQQQQQVQLPNLASFLANTLQSQQQAETQLPLQNPTLVTVNGNSSITSTNNGQTTPPNVAVKKSKAQERAASAKSMLYNAYLQALG